MYYVSFFSLDNLLLNVSSPGYKTDGVFNWTVFIALALWTMSESFSSPLPSGPPNSFRLVPLGGVNSQIWSQSKTLALCFLLSVAYFSSLSLLLSPPTHRAWTLFRLSFWMSVKRWLFIRLGWLITNQHHPPAIGWKGPVCVCSYTVAYVMPSPHCRGRNWFRKFLFLCHAWLTYNVPSWCDIQEEDALH